MAITHRWRCLSTASSDYSDDIHKTMEEFFGMSVYMYGAIHKPDQVDFDFCLLHLLTGINAI